MLLLSPVFFYLVYNELRNVYGWRCDAFSGHFHCVQVCFCNLVFVCESSVFLS